MARRLATVISHAPGLRGTPSISQRSSALTSASCSASSASVKSPSWLISAARTRPCSSRKVCSICVLAVIYLQKLAFNFTKKGFGQGHEICLAYLDLFAFFVFQHRLGWIIFDGLVQGHFVVVVHDRIRQQSDFV